MSGDPSDPVDPGRFVADLPVWLIVSQGFLTGGPLDPLVTTADVGQVLQVFTDEDLASRYIQEQKMSGVVPLPVRTPAALRQLLEDFEKAGGGHVGIDAGQGRARLYAVQEILDGIRED